MATLPNAVSYNPISVSLSAGDVSYIKASIGGVTKVSVAVEDLWIVFPDLKKNYLDDEGEYAQKATAKFAQKATAKFAADIKKAADFKRGQVALDELTGTENK